jgi:arylsulfatase A
LRGFKRDLYEGGHRVPFIVRWPGRAPEGAVSDALISQVDLFATLAAAAGIDVPAGAAHDSHNLLPVWTSNAPSPRRAIVHNTVDGAYAVREGKWVLVAAKSGSHNPMPAWFPQWAKTNGYAENEHPGELYDLGRDLAQKRNLYGELPEKVRELTRRMDEIRARGQVR